MPIPTYQAVMLPLLRFISDDKEHRMPETLEAMCTTFQLSAEERQALLPSGQMTVMRSRTGWARTYLKKAGLLEQPRRGCFRITERGRAVLRSNPERIDVKFLEQFPEFVAFQNLHHDPKAAAEPSVTHGAVETPEEALEAAYGELRSELEGELVEAVKNASPAFFEKLVVELLVRMGYGGSRQDAGQAVGKSGDGGIDGIIKEDHLGLDAIYIQAKRWEATVGRPELQKFAGALQGHRARKGVFITTSDYSSDARRYVSQIDSKIVLIDGEMLARLMIDHNVGVTVSRSYDIKKLDLDFFSEE